MEVHQAGEGDHGGIVGGEAWRTGKKLKPIFPAGRGQNGAEGAVTAHSSGERDQLAPSFMGCAQGLVDENINDSLLEGGAEMRKLVLEILDLGQGVAHCGLEPGEREVEFPGHGTRKLIGPGIATPCVVLDFWASGIRKAEKAGHFVKGFACGIIDGTAYELVVAHGPDMNEHGVTTRGNEGEVRRDFRIGILDGRLRIIEKWREEVALHVID